jgi:hypothetical protein
MSFNEINVLHKILSEFITTTKEIVLSNKQPFPHLTIEYFKLSFQKDGFYNIHKINRIDYGRVVDQLNNFIINQNSFKNLIEFLEKYLNLQKKDLFHLVFFILINYLNCLYDYSSDYAFTKIFNDLKKFLSQEYVYFYTLIPIKNLILDVERISLSNFIVIRKIKYNELEFFYNKTKNIDFVFNDYRYLVELKYKVKRDSFMKVPPSFYDGTINDHNDVIYKIITVLRLINNISVNHMYTFFKYEINFLPYAGQINRYDLHIPSSKSNIEKGKINEFIRLWKTFNKLAISDYSELELIISQYNYAFERKRLAEKAIDFAICLELLFSGEDIIKDSIRFKLSIRASRLLGKDFQEREDIAKQVKEFYDIRSSLVHGSKSKTKTDESKLLNIENIIRRSICKYINILNDKRENNFLHDDFIKHLDYA